MSSSNGNAPAPKTVETNNDDTRETATNYMQGVFNKAKTEVAEKRTSDAKHDVSSEDDAKPEEKPADINQADAEPEAKSDVKPDVPPQAKAKTQQISSDDIIQAQKIVANMNASALADIINAASAVSAVPTGGKKTRRRRKNKSKSAKRRR